jgi:hypothetical protein
MNSIENIPIKRVPKSEHEPPSDHEPLTDERRDEDRERTADRSPCLRVRFGRSAVTESREATAGAGTDAD